MSLFDSGIRPVIDKYLLDLSEERRDYGDYWSASSAGYCMRKNIFDRMQVPFVTNDPRKQRVFTSGHIFHEWIQGLTKDIGFSIAQELELQDDELMVRGHIDDLVLAGSEHSIEEAKRIAKPEWGKFLGVRAEGSPNPIYDFEYKELYASDFSQHLILYDYKTQNSRAFTYAKGRPMSYFHRMQLGTYMYMIRTMQEEEVKITELDNLPVLTEARILKISKDDLRMNEEQLLWSDELRDEVLSYWQTLNDYWKNRKLPACTCADQEGGFMAREKFNPYFYNDEPCSIEWFQLKKAEGVI